MLLGIGESWILWSSLNVPSGQFFVPNIPLFPTKSFVHFIANSPLLCSVPMFILDKGTKQRPFHVVTMKFTFKVKIDSLKISLRNYMPIVLCSLL